MRDLLTIQGQARWQEHIRKESISRATWKINYGHRFLKEKPPPPPTPGKRVQPAPSRQAPSRPALGAAPQPASSTPDLRAGLPETRRVRAPPTRAGGGQEPKRTPRRPAGRATPVFSEMRPVPLDTLQLLFHGVSHDGEGRASYLRERNRQKPAEKFQYPILSSWEYGWNLGDVVKNSRTSIYAKCQSIATTFQSKNGIFYFPQQTDQLM